MEHSLPIHMTGHEHTTVFGGFTDHTSHTQRSASREACPDAQCAAPERSSRIPRIPTATPNKRPPNI
eukprot:5744934-Prymnesium_polylepis.1